ncbi:hypothetical protein [Bradyrhizobium sp. 164]|uniref:hypothetical protein n=1 Tax=Bradyrhizobium sp. 164 TaxID=2782637 RepID=UPI001FFAE6F5|nr:hypothetical protein [Bradyrhizobium sp. 164]MCK1595477.1 hypothetical protein [Bradyrhizobium sp. 164]
MNRPLPEIAIGALGATAFWAALAASSMSAANLKDFAGPAATAFAAVIAGLIAYQLGRSQVEVAEKSWATANEKIVLDLFDKRLAIFEEIRSIISEVVRNGTAPTELHFRYVRAIDRVPYFFGGEVQAYLEQLRLHLLDLDLSNTMMENLIDPDRPKWVEKRSEQFLAVTQFYKEAASLFAPYMKAHQKA